MLRRRLIALPGLLLVACEVLAADRFVLPRGMPLEQALERLNADGLRLVYSSVMVPPSLTLANEVRGNDPLAAARDVLRAHGLKLRPLGAGLLAVVANGGLVAPQAEHRLFGTVLSGNSENPIAGARVEVADTRVVGWTDAKGAFRTEVTGSGPHVLRISAAGFETTVQMFDAGNDATAELQVRMTAAPAPLEQVVVVASRYTFDDAATAPFVLDQATIQLQAKLGEDPLQAIARLPGMLFSSYSGRPNVRGGEAGESLIVLDGMPIREPYHLPDYNSAFSVLDENMIARMTAYTGLMPARSGNRLSSVLDLKSVDPTLPARNVVALSTFHARAQTGNAGDAQGVDWLASARLGTLGQWIDKVAPDVGVPRTRDGMFMIERELTGGTLLRGQTLLSQSRFEFADPDLGEQATLRSNATYAWLSAQKGSGESLTVGALLGYSNISSRRAGNVAGGLTAQGELRDSRTARLWDLQLYSQWRAGARHSVETGLSLASGTGRYDYSSSAQFHPAAMLLFGVPESRTRQNILTAHRDLLGLHVADKWRLADRWYMEAGLRWDLDFADDTARRSYVSPRVALRWDPMPRSSLRLSWGRAVQSPEAHELRVEDDERALPVAQRLMQTVLSYEQLFLDGWTARIEGFDRRLRNPRVRYGNLFDPLRVLPDLSADRAALSPERARIRGLEISAQWEQGPWSLWSAYTWSKALDRLRGSWVPREWDQRSTLALAAGWERGPWSMSLQGSYHSGRPTTPVVEASLQAPALGMRNSRRIGSYLALDVRVARRFDIGAGTLVAYAQLTNMLDRRNPCCTELDLPDEDSDPTALEIQPLAGYPLLPAIGVSYEF